MQIRDPSTVSRLLAEIESLNNEILCAIDDTEDLDTAIKAANMLASACRELAETSNRKRTQIVGKIWDAEKTTLAALATRVGVSKSRADQLLQRSYRDRGTS